MGFNLMIYFFPLSMRIIRDSGCAVERFTSLFYCYRSCNVIKRGVV